jgi:uncharacterized protein (TIGR03663 family)
MKPQPPVTKMRIAARTSSATAGALADSPATDDWFAAFRERVLPQDWVPWAIIALAAFLRIFWLDIKPPHFDEGINGWFVDRMVQNGFYKYDPTNYHGPLHFYVLFLSQTLFGRNLWALRMPVVLLSITAVWFTMKFEPFFGRTLCRLAAVAMAISPGFLFYGRYAIHEIWLVVFSMLFIFGLFGLWRKGTPEYLWCTGMGIAGMILTKETYIIHVGCALAALPVTWLSHKLNNANDVRRAKQLWDWFDLGMVLLVGIAAIVFFYSGTFFHWGGVKGLYKCFEAWFQTGGKGNGHEKDQFDLIKGVHWLNYYWLWLMARYEWPLLVGVVGCAACQFYKNVYIRYLAIYAVGVLVAYSIVHYKTPWCIISIAWPFAFIFGAAVLLVPATYRRITTAVTALLLSVSLGQAIVLNYFRCTTDTEPYVYVQTYNDIWKLTRPLLKLAHRDPVYYQMVGHLIRTSSYPLPWLLNDFTHIGYYEHNNAPQKMDADFLLVQEDRVPEVEAKLRGAYYTDWMRIRSFQEPSKLYFSAKTFAEFFRHRAPDFQGKATP